MQYPPPHKTQNAISIALDIDSNTIILPIDDLKDFFDVKCSRTIFELLQERSKHAPGAVFISNMGSGAFDPGNSFRLLIVKDHIMGYSI